VTDGAGIGGGGRSSADSSDPAPRDGLEPVEYPLSVAELRKALQGAQGADDDELARVISVAAYHLTANLLPEWQPDELGVYPPWPPDLLDGLRIAAMLTYRNSESPSAATTEGGYSSAGLYGVPIPATPPIVWDPRIRHRVARYLDTAGMVG
jgi:hypothetical protein